MRENNGELLTHNRPKLSHWDFIKISKDFHDDIFTLVFSVAVPIQNVTKKLFLFSHLPQSHYNDSCSP